MHSNDRILSAPEQMPDTLVGCISKAVYARRLQVQFLAEAALICTFQVEVRGHYPAKGGGNCLSIESSLSDAIVHNWLWLTATMSFP